jgi:hypothetical protein
MKIHCAIEHVTQDILIQVLSLSDEIRVVKKDSENRWSR